MKVKFKEWVCDVEFCEYGNGTPAIRLNDAIDGSPVAVASVNLEGISKVETGEIAIKDYSENQGMLKALKDVGIVSEPIRHVKSGYVNIPVCKLLIIGSKQHGKIKKSRSAVIIESLAAATRQGLLAWHIKGNDLEMYMKAPGQTFGTLTVSLPEPTQQGGTIICEC
jgi:hypothetical protein